MSQNVCKLKKTTLVLTDDNASTCCLQWPSVFNQPAGELWVVCQLIFFLQSNCWNCFKLENKFDLICAKHEFANCIFLCKLIKTLMMCHCVHWHLACSSIYVKLLTPDTPCPAGFTWLQGCKLTESICAVCIQVWMTTGENLLLLCSLVALLSLHWNDICVPFMMLL